MRIRNDPENHGVSNERYGGSHQSVTPQDRPHPKSIELRRDSMLRKTTAGHATCQSAKLQVECQRFSASFTSLNFLTDVGPKQGQTSAKMVLQYTWMEPCSWDGPIFYRPCWDQRVDLSPTHGDARVRQNYTGGQSALHLLWRCDVKTAGIKGSMGRLKRYWWLTRPGKLTACELEKSPLLIDKSTISTGPSSIA